MLNVCSSILELFIHLKESTFDVVLVSLSSHSLITSPAKSFAYCERSFEMKQIGLVFLTLFSLGEGFLEGFLFTQNMA